MKTLKRIEIVAVLLFVTVIIFASFFGVYKKEDFRTVNLIKGYDLGMQFTETREVKMTVSTAEEDVIYDSEGNTVIDDGETEFTEENGYKTETVKLNPDDVLTEENYNLSKEILKNRLKGMDVGEYKIELNNETGEILVKIQENDEAEEIVYHIEQQGIITIVDKETNEILLDNNDIKSTQVIYGPTDETGTSIVVHLKIEFNEDSERKVEEISKVYAQSSEKQENEEGESKEEDTTKYLNVLLDGATLNSTAFVEKMVLYVPMAVVNDNLALEQSKKEVEHLSTIINNGTLPIIYEYTEETVESQTDKNILFIGILVSIVLLSVACIVLVVKFKSKGFILTFLQIGYIALLLLAVRYTNVVITIEGIVGVIISIILNYILVYAILNNLKKKERIEWKTIGKFALRTIPVYILAIIFAFDSLTRINSLGMTLVWGSIVLYVYNLLITRTVLKLLNK